MSGEIWNPLILSLKCSCVSVGLTIPWGLTWGWWLARHKGPWAMVWEAVLCVPLVLPPVVMGYVLLTWLNPDSFLGSFFLKHMGWRFVLDWKGAALAAAVVSYPFMLISVKHAFERLPPRRLRIAALFGADSWTIARKIIWPHVMPSVVAGSFLVFARSMGEFGATMIVAGNIAGRTQTLPLAIYAAIFQGETHHAMILSVIASLMALLAVAGHRLWMKYGMGFE